MQNSHDEILLYHLLKNDTVMPTKVPLETIPNIGLPNTQHSLSTDVSHVDKAISMNDEIVIAGVLPAKFKVASTDIFDEINANGCKYGFHGTNPLSISKLASSFKYNSNNDKHCYDAVTLTGVTRGTPSQKKI